MPANKNPSGARSVRVRMYRHGLGDCFLLSFPAAKRGQQFNVLIDCGLISVAQNPRDKMRAVAQDIQKVAKNQLDLVVVTHQHWDHVSGFSREQAQEIFAGIKMRRVWRAWTEDPTNKLGQRLRAEREAKARTLHQAAIALRNAQIHGADVCLGLLERLEAQLTFFGLARASETPLASAEEGTTGKVQQAFDFPGSQSPSVVHYCYPTDSPQEFPELPGVRIYVLGPPENEALLKQSDPTAKGREVYDVSTDTEFASHLAAGFARLAAADDSASQPTADLPFDAYLRQQPDQSPTLKKLLAATWDAPGQDWRKIQADWTTAAESLALSLDKHTNNTSLALAFEFIGSGKVLLFPGDAQVGNWLSWQDLEWKTRTGEAERVIKGPALLARTVFYKVGHHGSHNATLRDHGLELMNHPDLVAFIPVNITEARKNRWFEMPFNNLVQRLKEKARGRVVLSDLDTPLPSDSDLSALNPAEKRAFRRALQPGPAGLYCDFLVNGG